MRGKQHPNEQVNIQLTKVAIERNEYKRANYMYRVGRYQANQLVFVDESACNKRTVYRNYGWALSGTRAIKRACFVCGRRYVELRQFSSYEE